MTTLQKLCRIVGFGLKLKNSILPDSSFTFHTEEKPPSQDKPYPTMRNKDPSNTAAWKVSVIMTAFIPPWDEKKRTKKLTDQLVKKLSNFKEEYKPETHKRYKLRRLEWRLYKYSGPWL